MCNKIIVQEFKNQRGFSLILVLFLTVVVSLLLAAMTQLIRGGSSVTGIEIQSARALLAAESGAQIAAMKLFPIGGSTPGCTAVPAAQAFTVGGLANCSATLTCASTTAAGRTIYTVTSEGKCGSVNDYARRRITVGLRGL